MRNAIIGLILIAGSSFAQTAEDGPKFEAADVHVSAKTTNAFLRNSPVHAGRYEIKTATMVDLVHLAYGYDSDKVLGGPNWLEMDRFDITAKVPAGSNPETQKEMLQALLQDRFHLVTRKEIRPLPTFALVQGKKPQIKEAAGTEDAGCKPQNGPPGENGGRLTMGNANGTNTTLTLGPGMTVQFSCRNMTMDAFASSLRSMIGANIGPNPILNETGLKGAWNFDLKYSLQLNGMLGGGTVERISLPDAIDKQLGLKLEEKQVPTPVIVVDKVNRIPTGNSPDIAEVLPPIPVPTEFEVASIKPSDAGGSGPMMSRFQMQPGNRLIVDNMPLRFLINRAFNTNNNDSVAGIPKFAETDRYDVVAKASGGGPVAQFDMEAVAPLVRSLLADRFKMKYHTEDRPVMAYTLVGAKPKMKKADPNSRSWCKYLPSPPGSAPGTRAFSCQNVTMDQFAERLQGMTSDVQWPVTNSTEVEGGWDLTLTFTMGPMMAMGAGRGGDAPAAAAPTPSASDPTGGYTFLEAIEKQLGLKLEKQKRTLPVIVIDSIEQKPTEN